MNKEDIKSKEFFNELGDLINRFSNKFPAAEAVYILVDQACCMALNSKGYTNAESILKLYEIINVCIEGELNKK